MNRIKSNKRYLWNLYVFPLVLFTTVTCYPTGKPDLEAQPEIRDEKHFPNGTVMGKYTYMDNDGNPVQVKYYADDASYGVELKSIKVVDSPGDLQASGTQTPATVQSAQNILSNQNKFDYNVMKMQETDAKMSTDLLSNNLPTIGYKYNKNSDPYDFLNKEINKINRYKIEKPNPDYEIYYQNELKGPKKCGKDKVRVYFDKENRKIRSAVDNYDADKFCEQF